MENNLPNGWVESRVGEVFLEITNGITLTQNKKQQGIPVSRIETIQNSQFDLNRIQHIDKTLISSEQIDKSKYKNGDIALSHINSMEHVGKTAIYNGEPKLFIHGMNLLRLRLGHSYIIPKFAFYQMQSNWFRENVRSRAGRSVNQVSINQKNLSSIPFVIAPLAEQQRIVAKLDAVLGRCKNCKTRLEKMPALLKSFRQRVLTTVLSGELTYIDEIKLESLGNLIEDLKYGTSQKSDYKNEGVAILRIPNIGTDGKIINSGLKYADLPKNEYSKLKLDENDILLIRSNGSVSLVGRTAIVSKEQVGFAFAGYLIRLRCNLQKLLPKYLNYILSSNDLRTQIELVARSTSGVNNINSEEVKALQIPTPSVKDQKEIIRKIEELFHLADSIEARYQKAKAWFDKIPQAILAKAVRGELIAQNENDEPAGMLLGKIKDAESVQTSKSKKVSTVHVKRGKRIAIKKEQIELHMNLIEIIKKTFGESSFSYENLEASITLKSKAEYIEMKKQLFSLLRNEKQKKKGINLLSTVDKSGIIQFKLHER